MRFALYFISSIILGLLPGYCFSCPENEIETDCINPCNTCDQKSHCNLPPECQFGCDCKPGFLRDENGYCVPEQQCQAKPVEHRCPKNAVYQPCAHPPVPTCENPYPEPHPDGECTAGCVCRPGFLKRKDARCVIPEQCYDRQEPEKEVKPEERRCPKNAMYQPCAHPPVPTCENPYPEPHPDGECTPGCVCRPGFLKRKDARCVLPEQCYDRQEPEKKVKPEERRCPKNAVYQPCAHPPVPTCENPYPEPHPDGECTPGCVCRPGFLKRKDARCVIPERCYDREDPDKEKPSAPMCPENAIFSACGSPCPPTCENRQPEPCDEKCIRACFCKPGFLLKMDEKRCVKPEHCNATHVPGKCGENQEYSECGSACPPDCSNLGKSIMCTMQCVPGCFCRAGLVKNDHGKCVKPEECPKHTCGVNEEYQECASACPPSCENLGKNVMCTMQCVSGCFCVKGLVRSKEGKCVPLEECPQTPPQPICAQDEQFYNCTPSCYNTCKRLLNPNLRCRCGPPGCFCKEGLVKRSDGKCVPRSLCNVSNHHQCSTNQQYYECTPICKNTCEHLFNPAIKCGCGPPGCFCKDGFVKRADGKCVRPSRCKRCLIAGEEFQECGTSCPDTCENRGVHPPPCPYPCQRGCFCRKGLFRNKENKCVHIEACPKTRYNSTHAPTPTKKAEKRDVNAVTATDDRHGCPDRGECDAYCKCLGNFKGLCVGNGSLQCRCV